MLFYNLINYINNTFILFRLEDFVKFIKTFLFDYEYLVTI